MINVDTIELEQGVTFAIIDELKIGSKTYLYLVNVNDVNDFCIRKLSDDEEDVIPLDDDKEFERALEVFTKKYKNEEF